MNPREFDGELSRGELKPLYLFHGQESLLRESYLGKAAALVQEGFRDFNLQTLMASEVSAGEVLDLARTLAFMSPPRVLILRSCEAYSADDWALFLRYLESPNTDNLLILDMEKADFRLKFFKALQKNQMTVSFDAPRGRELIAWVMDSMKKRGRNLPDNAARFLIDRVGTDLMELDRELEKLSLYNPGKEQVGLDEIREVTRFGARASVFELGDAVGSQDSEKALTALDNLLQTEHHLPVLIMLIRHFRMLLKVMTLGSRPSAGDAAKVLKVPPFVAKKYLEQARELDLADIKKGLVLLQEANLTLVKSSTPPRLVMDRLVLQLTQLRRSTRPRPRRTSGPYG